MKILAVIDMQNDFIDGSLGTPEAQAIVPKVVSKVRQFDGTVVYTRDTHGAVYLDTQEGRNLPVVHCVKDTPGWQLTEELEELRCADHSPIFDKPAFGSMELARFLAARAQTEELTEVELVGLCTDICVISNAMLLKTVLPEITITVDASCCAGVTPESHRNALNAMKMCQISVTNEDE
ncbi:MAG: cysteine hydrolase [Lachnospiraceae bacterium]|nr:cysteine hydrolase [Lachnospiraceae bacterium]